MPDARAWTLWGRDPAAHGIAPAVAPEQAEALVLPDPLPQELARAVAAAWARMPAPRRLMAWPAALEGGPAAEALEPVREAGPHEGHAGRGNDRHASSARGMPGACDTVSQRTAPAVGDDGDPAGHAAHAGDAGHAGHASHADHAGRASPADDADGAEAGSASHADHAATMEITGDPSADGLVMEPVAVELGPLAAGVPGGIVLELTLDGDVVASCRPRALLTASAAGLAAGLPPDSLAPVAWAAALAASRGERLGSRQVAGIECERALSHATWLRSLGELLGWAELAERAQAAVSALLPARLALERGHDERARAGLAATLPPLERLLGLVDGSRRLRVRTRGRAVAAAASLRPTPIGGPVARAAGIERDARAGDPTYAALGFRTELHDAGDAEARTLVRAREAPASVRLALAGLDNRDRAAAAVEGPRGPLEVRVHGAHTALSAPGTEELLAVAGEAVAGLELASALVGIASFDLSPWRVGG